MNHSDFSKAVKSGKTGGAYLLYGKEEYVKDLAVRVVCDTYVNQGLKELNYDKIDGSECEMSDIARSCNQLPVMSARRVVAVYGLPVFQMSSSQLNQTSGQKALEELERTVIGCPMETVLLFVVRGDASPALAKLFSQHKRNVEFKPPSGTEKIKYLRREAEDIDLKISDSLLKTLMDYTDMSLLELGSELSKLKAYVGMEDASEKDIFEVCTAGAEYNVFKMLRRISAGDGAGAISEYRNLVLSGQSPQAIIAMIEHQYRALFYINEINENNVDFKSAASLLSTRDFVIKNMERTANELSKDKINKIAQWCADADYLVKKGKVDANSSTELLIMRLISI